MVEIKISIPEKMHSLMKKYPKIDWNEVALNAIDKKLKDIQLLTDLKDRDEGEVAIARGDGIPLDEIIREMGLGKKAIKKITPKVKAKPKVNETKKTIKKKTHARKR